MNRKELRVHIRTLADELIPHQAHKGLFEDPELDVLINISQQNVYVELLDFFPKKFRKPATFNTEASKRTYDISSDLLITDFFRFENIFTNTTGCYPVPLAYIEPEEISQYATVGQTGEPQGFGYEEDGVIFFEKTPNAVYPYKAFYFPEIPDLNHDTSDADTDVATPHIPKIAHPLIAFDVLEQWEIRDQSVIRRLADRRDKVFEIVTRALSAREGMSSGKSPHIRTILGYQTK